MSNPSGIPLKDQLSTYVWKDQQLTDEMIERIKIEDHLITVAMGGVMSEQVDAERFLNILDVGSGTGIWLLEVAEEYPKVKELVGIDASPQMLAVAGLQAQARQLEKRVQFRAMNALGILNFPDASFDLVNMRFGSNFLRTWEWNLLLQEMRRITRPGGVIRISDLDIMESSNELITNCNDFVQHAFYQSGHFFTHQKDGLTSELVSLLQKQGYEEVQMREYSKSYVDGPIEKQLIEYLLSDVFQMLHPFLRKWARAPDRLEDFSQQILLEMQQPGFEATMTIKTAWGIVPSKGDWDIKKGT